MTQNTTNYTADKVAHWMKDGSTVFTEVRGKPLMVCFTGMPWFPKRAATVHSALICMAPELFQYAKRQAEHDPEAARLVNTIRELSE